MEYSKYPLCQRLLFLITGFCSPLVGLSLYFIFKDDKSKKWQAEFLQRGSVFGLVFCALAIIIAVVKQFV